MFTNQLNSADPTSYEQGNVAPRTAPRELTPDEMSSVSGGKHWFTYLKHFFRDHSVKAGSDGVEITPK